jgi:hypothetical protein
MVKRDRYLNEASPARTKSPGSGAKRWQVQGFCSWSGWASLSYNGAVASDFWMVSTALTHLPGGRQRRSSLCPGSKPDSLSQGWSSWVG